MGKRRKGRVDLLTLEQQIEVMPARPTLDPVEPWMDAAGAEAQVAWDRRRAELLKAISHRDAKKLRDPGRDGSGNYSPSPYAARGHDVEIAPKSLGKELPKEASFPKRITTQRMIDRYKARSQVTLRQWRAANTLWEWWNAMGLEQRVAAGYEIVTVHSSPSKDGLIAKKLDAATCWTEAMQAVPYRSRGVVRAVVVEDQSAGAWAHQRGVRRDDSGRVGMGRLRAGLQALAEHLKY